MKIDCPRAVRETYGKLLEAPLRDAVQNTLDHPGGENTPTGERWRQWLVQFCIREFHLEHLDTSDDLRLCQWVAFALRYLHPLVAGKDKPQSGDAVINVINNYAVVVSTLLFGSEAECLVILKKAFDPVLLHQEIQISSDHWQILRSVQHRSSDEKSARNWSAALRERLKSRVVNYFHDEEEHARRVLSSALRSQSANFNATPSVTGYRSQFEHYIALAVERQDRPGYGQALGSLNVFTKRMDLAEHYARQAKWQMLVFFVAMISIAMLPIEALVKWVLIGLLTFNVIALFYGRILGYLADAFAAAQADLATLETLLGDKDME